MCEEAYSVLKDELNRILDELRKPFHPSQITFKPGAVKGDRALALAYADLRVYMNRLDEVCGSDWSVAYEPWGEDRIICRLTILGITRSSTGETTNESEKGEIGGTVAEAQAFKRAATMFGLGRYIYQLPSGWVDYDPASKKFTEGAKAKLNGILMQHYRKATEGKPQHGPQPTQTHAETTPAQNVDGDTTDAPTEAEIAIIRQWSNRTEAEMWAVMVGACENEHEAKNSLNKSVAKYGGEANASNIDAIYVDFVRHQLDKLQDALHALGGDIYGEQWPQVCERNVHRITGGATKDSRKLTPEQIQKLLTGIKKLASKREAA